jgi:hypothetical protein
MIFLPFPHCVLIVMVFFFSCVIAASLRSSQQEQPQAKGGRPAPIVNINIDGTERDIPPTFQHEHLHDWSICKPGHRQGKVVELGDGKFAVEISGEPVVWIFSRSASGSLSSTPPAGNVAGGNNKFLTNSIWQNAQQAQQAQAHGKQKKPTGPTGTQQVPSTPMSTSESLFATTMRSDSSRAGGIVYLLEVHYMIRLQTGQVRPFLLYPVFVSD